MSQNATKNNSLIGGVVFTIVGVLSIGIGGFTWQDNTQFQQRALVTKGRVVNMRASSNRKGTVYYPVVSYSLGDGAPRRMESKVGSYPPRFRVGDEVEVLYDPQNISDVRLKADVEFVILPIALMVGGAVFAVIGGGIIAEKFYPKT